MIEKIPLHPPFTKWEIRRKDFGRDGMTISEVAAGFSLRKITMDLQVIKFFYGKPCLGYEFTEQAGAEFFMLRYG